MRGNGKRKNKAKNPYGGQYIAHRIRRKINRIWIEVQTCRVQEAQGIAPYVSISWHMPIIEKLGLFKNVRINIFYSRIFENCTGISDLSNLVLPCMEKIGHKSYSINNFWIWSHNCIG